MSYEVQCGECAEIILIEDLGVEVACPHCEAVLILHEKDVSPTEDSESTDERFTFPAPPTEQSNTGEPEAQIPNFDFLGTSQETAELPQIKIDLDAGKNPSSESPKESSNTAVEEKTKPSTEASQQVDSEKDSSRRSSKRSAPKISGVSDLVFKSLLSYSVCITLALLYLMYSYRTEKPHQLESLPDIRPWKEGEFIKIEETAKLPPGHSLRLGETQRFGNIKVTPLRVTREPLRFVHFQGEAAGSKPASDPVLKLWFRIENVSQNQKFAPLDQELALLRHVDQKDYRNVMSNTWICRVSDLSSKRPRTLMYDHPKYSNYNIKGMANESLSPGESIETFLPSQTEELESLQGELVWRVQIRKGFNPQSMNGVTTLFDVVFDSKDISQG